MINYYRSRHNKNQSTAIMQFNGENCIECARFLGIKAFTIRKDYFSNNCMCFFSQQNILTLLFKDDYLWIDNIDNNIYINKVNKDLLDIIYLKI